MNLHKILRELLKIHFDVKLDTNLACDASGQSKSHQNTDVEQHYAF